MLGTGFLSKNNLVLAALLSFAGFMNPPEAFAQTDEMPRDFWARCSEANRILALTRAGFDPKMEVSIHLGLDALKKQQTVDGSWGTKMKVGTTALALMALFGHGETPLSPAYGECVRKGVKWLNAMPVAGAKANEILKGEALELLGMGDWEFAMGTAALAEYATLSRDATVHPLVHASAELLVRQQLPTGGWGPTAKPTRGWADGDAAALGDICRTGWAVQALVAVKKAGQAPQGTEAAIEKAQEFVNALTRSNGLMGCRKAAAKNATSEDIWRTAVGVFILDQPSRSSATNSAIAAKALSYILKETDANGLRKSKGHNYDYPLQVAIGSPMRMLPSQSQHTMELGSYYYAAIAGRLAGSETWQRARSRYILPVLKSQSQDGTWPVEGDSWSPPFNIINMDVMLDNFKDAAYRNAACLLICETPYRIIPKLEEGFFKKVNVPAIPAIPK